MSEKPKYRTLIDQKVVLKLVTYLEQAKTNPDEMGAYLKNQLQKANKDISDLTPSEFLEIMIQTKIPQIFAESQIRGDKSDWSQKELEILGDVGMSVPVNIYDNGVHRGSGIQNHDEPFEGELLFVPGALLSGNSPDLKEVTTPDGKISEEEFFKLYERRLLPQLIRANQSAGKEGAVVTIPGMGCGAFAGKFEGKLEPILRKSLERIIEKHQDKLTNVKAIVFDPNENTQGMEDKTRNIGKTTFISKAGKFGTVNSQLKKPEEYDASLKGAKFFSIVAWDHVSWPGNDFYSQNSRQTDDGVKGAASNVCQVLTGKAGEYDKATHKFKTKSNHDDWDSVIAAEEIQLHSKDSTLALGEDGKFFDLNLIQNVNSILPSGLPLIAETVKDGTFNQEAFDALVNGGADVNTKDKGDFPVICQTMLGNQFNKKAFDALVAAGAKLPEHFPPGISEEMKTHAQKEYQAFRETRKEKVSSLAAESAKLRKQNSLIRKILGSDARIDEIKAEMRKQYGYSSQRTEAKLKLPNSGKAR